VTRRWDRHATAAGTGDRRLAGHPQIGHPTRLAEQACTNQAPSSSSMATGTVRASPDRRPRTVSSTFGAPVGTASPPHSRRSPSSGTRRGRSRATFRSGTRWVNPAFNSSSGPTAPTVTPSESVQCGSRPAHSLARPLGQVLAIGHLLRPPVAPRGPRHHACPTACSGIAMLISVLWAVDGQRRSPI
jgi:hypothetical protein